MKIPQYVTRAYGSSKLTLSKNGPTIMTVAGVAGFALTTALTVRSTIKMQESETLPELKKKIKEAKNDELLFADSKEKVRYLSNQYKAFSLELTKIYWPVVASGSASIVCVLTAHNIMLKRQAALVAAYVALDGSYKAYRQRVAEKIGVDEERELFTRVPPCVKDGDEEGDACEILAANELLPSPYARFFDECSRNWRKTPEYNLLFLRSQQQWANDRLHAFGHIFLNEVYDALGLERSQAGQAVGWKLDGNGDGYVDFGLYVIGDENNRAFTNLLEPTVLLDFNVDGPIRI